MSEKAILPGGAAWMMGILGTGMMAAAAFGMVDKDRREFQKLILDKKIADPKEVWGACRSYHKGLREELTKARVRIQAGEEIVRVGQGLLEVRKMMEDQALPGDIRLRRVFGEEIPEEEMKAAYEKIEKARVPPEVKSAIIAHWWTELMQLFVPWGILVAEEIELAEDPFFKLVGAESREAVLRAEVYKYKELYESRATSLNDMAKRANEAEQGKKELLDQIAELQKQLEVKA